MATVQAEIERANREFGRALLKMAQSSGEAFWDVLRKGALDLMRDVTLDTPVDTGRARAAWTSVFKRFHAPVPSNPGRDMFAKAMGLREGSTTVDVGERVRVLKSGSARIKETIQIEVQNRVPYIVFLERGHSGKAPAGFVQINLYLHAAHMRRAVERMEARG